MPKIHLKSSDQIMIMAEGGRKLGSILNEVLGKVSPGISTLEIDCWIEDRIGNVGGEPSFKMVPRYHWASCVGLNEEVVHSIPRKEKIIKAGDLLKIDLGMFWQGFHMDLAWTIIAGRCRDAEMQRCREDFLLAGERALAEAIKVAKPGSRVGNISQKIEEVIRKAGYSPVEILTGHGIGRKLHEEPLIPEFLRGKISDTSELQPGMALAIEVIYNSGKPEVILKDDGWTVVTKDGKMSGLFEKTIAVTETEPLILTPLAGV